MESAKFGRKKFERSLKSVLGWADTEQVGYIMYMTTTATGYLPSGPKVVWQGVWVCPKLIWLTKSRNSKLSSEWHKISLEQSAYFSNRKLLSRYGNVLELAISGILQDKQSTDDMQLEKADSVAQTLIMPLKTGRVTTWTGSSHLSS